jgi:DNA-binding response OmpR family regulator
MARKPKVLVIDDDAGLIKMMGLILHRAGYKVEAATSGIDGLAKIDEFKPDIVILDRMMPLMDGLEVARRLRARPTTAQIPIIMLSALGSVDEKVDGFEAGVDDYVHKPVEPKELLARTRALLMRANYSRPQAAKTVSIIGSKGGVGATTVAINVAVTLAKQGNSVILAELRSEGGTMRHQLKLSSGQDLSHLLAMKADQIKRPEIERRIITHSSGMQLLLAPQIGNGDKLTPAHVELLLDVMTSRAQFVILDLPTTPDQNTRRTFELSDQILLVTEPETLSVSCGYMQLRNMKEWDVFDRVNLVVSTRTPSASWLNRVEVENRLGMGGGEARQASRWEPRALEVDVRMRQGVAGVIPSAPELFHESVRAGVPITLIEPSAPAARALLDLADWLADKQPEDNLIQEPVLYVN